MAKVACDIEAQQLVVAPSVLYSREIQLKHIELAWEKVCPQGKSLEVRVISENTNYKEEINRKEHSCG